MRKKKTSANENESGFSSQTILRVLDQHFSATKIGANKYWTQFNRAFTLGLYLHDSLFSFINSRLNFK